MEKQRIADFRHSRHFQDAFARQTTMCGLSTLSCALEQFQHKHFDQAGFANI